MNKLYITAVSIILLLSSACSRTDLWNKMNENNKSSPSAITAAVSPASGAWLSAKSGSINSTITIHFNKSMDNTGPSMSGILGSGAASWSTTTSADDTLTISPGSWPSGKDAVLTLTCLSLDGASITLNLTYNIAQSVYYVNSSNTSGPWTGTRAEPMNNIQNAVDAAFLGGTPGVVLVAEGLFSSAATLVSMKEKVSLYGGYSAADWDVRDPAVFITRLEDTRTTISTTLNINNPIRLIEFLPGITSLTVLDGFTISAAPVESGTNTLEPNAVAAIFIQNASPVISNNIITSPDMSIGTNVTTTGICYITGGTAEIHHNTINLGKRGGTSSTCSNYAIYCNNGAKPEIHDNTIKAGESSGTAGYTFGIYLQTNCAGSIYNNPVIDGGRGFESGTGIVLRQSTTTIINNSLITASTSQPAKRAYGISLQNQANSIIEKNILKDFSTDSVTCISVSSQSRSVIRSNYINGGSCGTVYGIQINNDITGETQYTDIYNNVINAGTGTMTAGIEIFSISTRVRILNNTINGGSGNTASAINLKRAASSTPGTDTRIEISNNNLFTNRAPGSSCGIREWPTALSVPYPNVVSNNNIFNCGMLYSDFDGVSSSVSITDINILNSFKPDGTTTAEANISENIYSVIISNEGYRYTGAGADLSAVTFDTSAIDGSSLFGFSVDRDAVTRTPSWSIGAYEY